MRKPLSLDRLGGQHAPPPCGGALLRLARAPGARELAADPKVQAEIHALLRRSQPLVEASSQLERDRLSVQALRLKLKRSRLQVQALKATIHRLRIQLLGPREATARVPLIPLEKEMLAHVADLILPFNLPTLRSPYRGKYVVAARKSAMIRLREKGYSLTEIGLFFARSHCTVIHALQEAL